MMHTIKVAVDEGLSRAIHRARVAAAHTGMHQEVYRSNGGGWDSHARMCGQPVGRATVAIVSPSGHVELTAGSPVRITSIGGALAPEGVDEGTLRQGEWYFVPAKAPELSTFGAWERDGEESQAGSYTESRCYEVATFDRRRRHMPTECRVLERRGETGRGRPRVYVRGSVAHPEHGTLILPDGWYRVIPNHAHGPFAAGAFSPAGRGADPR